MSTEDDLDSIREQLGGLYTDVVDLECRMKKLEEACEKGFELQIKLAGDMKEFLVRKQYEW